MTRTLLFLAATLAACSTTDAPLAPGSTVLQVSYVAGVGQVAMGGVLSTIETAFEPCDAATLHDGANDYAFDGDLALAEVTLPDGDLCGIRMVATELVIEVEDDGVAKTIIGQDFDLVVPGAATSVGDTLNLQLGDDTWLSEFVPLAPEGTTHLNSEADPALVAAFFDGLARGSSFTAEPAPFVD